MYSTCYVISRDKGFVLLILIYYYYYYYYYSIPLQIITPAKIRILAKGMFLDKQYPTLSDFTADLNSQRRYLLALDVKQLKYGVAFCGAPFVLFHTRAHTIAHSHTLIFISQQGSMNQ